MFCRRNRAAAKENARMYNLGKVYGYLDALKELTTAIQVETQLREEKAHLVSPSEPPWTLHSFTCWLEGEVLRMSKTKQIPPGEWVKEVERVQSRLDRLTRRRR
ncbi:hypothetical protein ERK16_87 [Mycobacterium phage Erk16]|uniref:Uncharacterized protein n=1 Tax=Mycobacterium phage Erk16 TaxID=2234027 RepID=A0A2Z4Q232_9CAUD|nr:hypothetical protein ERK16_87 [Mycobacterium phage Erk16]